MRRVPLIAYWYEAGRVVRRLLPEIIGATIALILLALSACSLVSPTQSAGSVPNLDRVDANVWRSGQITTPEGWQTIASLADGRHVHVLKLNFDDEGSDAGAAEIGAEVIDVAIDPHGDQDAWSDVVAAFRAPDPEQLNVAMRALDMARGSPGDFYLVHCTHGQDRTGLVVGMHRVLHDGWTPAAAYAEMRAHHFHPELHGVAEAWGAFARAHQ